MGHHVRLENFFKAFIENDIWIHIEDHVVCQDFFESFYGK